MKVTKYLVLNLALVLSLVGNFSFAHGQTPASERPTRLVVSFYSICCGIDDKAKENLDNFIKGYEKAKRKQLARSAVSWGREGEIDYCMKLSELSRKEQKRFVAKVRSLLNSSKLVHIYENAGCQNGR